MAKISGNLIIHGLSGMLGKQIIVRRLKNGDCVIYAYTAAPPREATPAQHAHRTRFREAVRYGKARKHLPVYQAIAATRNASAYNVAVSDFMHPPTILSIDLSAYHGAAGQELRITAVDDVEVAAVNVLLAEDDGTLIEKGHAVVSAVDPSHWVYTTTLDAPSASVRIHVDAVDLAGQATQREVHT